MRCRSLKALILVKKARRPNPFVVAYPHDQALFDNLLRPNATPTKLTRCNVADRGKYAVKKSQRSCVLPSSSSYIKPDSQPFFGQRGCGPPISKRDVIVQMALN